MSDHNTVPISSDITTLEPAARIVMMPSSTSSIIPYMLVSQEGKSESEPVARAVMAPSSTSSIINPYELQRSTYNLGPEPDVRAVTAPTMASTCSFLQNTAHSAYELTKGAARLGTGAFSQVFAATRRSDGAKAALKVFLDGVSTEQRRAEIHLLDNLAKHNNIIQMFTSDAHEDWILFERMDTDLSVIKTELGPLSPNHLQIVQQLLSAAAHLHENGIIHGDIKPENVFVTRMTSGTIQVKFGDLGHAQWVSAPRRPLPVTTLHYRSPEACYRDKNYSTPVDCWSIGCVMVEICTGVCLFPGVPLQDLLWCDAAQIVAIYSVLDRHEQEKGWIGVKELPNYALATSLLQQEPPKGLPKRLKGVFLQLAHKLLACSPARRATAAEALQLIQGQGISSQAFHSGGNDYRETYSSTHSYYNNNSGLELTGRAYIEEMTRQLDFMDGEERQSASTTTAHCFYTSEPNKATDPTGAAKVRVYTERTCSVKVVLYQRLSLRMRKSHDLGNILCDGTVVDLDFSSNLKEFVLLLHIQRDKLVLPNQFGSSTITPSYDPTTYNRRKKVIADLRERLDLGVLTSHEKLLIGTIDQIARFSLDGESAREREDSLPEVIRTSGLFNALNHEQRIACLRAASEQLTCNQAGAGTGKTTTSAIICVIHLLLEREEAALAKETEAAALAEQELQREATSSAPKFARPMLEDEADLISMQEDEVEDSNNATTARRRMLVGAFATTNSACDVIMQKIYDLTGQLQSFHAFNATLIQSAFEASTRSTQPPYSLDSIVQKHINTYHPGETAIWKWLRANPKDDAKTDAYLYRTHVEQAEAEVLEKTDMMCCTLSTSQDPRVLQLAGRFRVCAIEEGGHATVTDVLGVTKLLAPGGHLIVSGDVQQTEPYCTNENLTLIKESCLKRVMRRNQTCCNILSEQMRMVPPLGDFVSQHIYEGQLRNALSVISRPVPHHIAQGSWYNTEHSMVWLHTPGKMEPYGESQVNYDEAVRVVRMALYFLRLGAEVENMMVVTIYAGQQEVLQYELTRAGCPVRVFTAEGSQGQEADICIVSCVSNRSTHKDFVVHRNRQAVQLTRAKWLLVMVGDVRAFRENFKDSIFGELAKQLAKTHCVFSGDEFPLHEMNFWRHSCKRQPEIPSICIAPLLALIPGFDFGTFPSRIQEFADAQVPTPAQSPTEPKLPHDAGKRKFDEISSDFFSTDELASGSGVQPSVAPSNPVTSTAEYWAKLAKKAKKKVNVWSNQVETCGSDGKCKHIFLSATERIDLLTLREYLDYVMGDELLQKFLVPDIMKLFTSGPCVGWVRARGTFPCITQEELLEGKSGEV